MDQIKRRISPKSFFKRPSCGNGFRAFTQQYASSSNNNAKPVLSKLLENVSDHQQMDQYLDSGKSLSSMMRDSVLIIFMSQLVSQIMKQKWGKL